MRKVPPGIRAMSLYFICHISYATWGMSSLFGIALPSMKRPRAHRHADNRDQTEHQQQRRRDERNRNRELVFAGNKPLTHKRLPVGAQFEHEGDMPPDAQREHDDTEHDQSHAEVARRFASK